ncbi:MAG TPA: RNase adapter RapZ, partial [Sutterella sp.]|nr:RNase adapter RapZ [Sutterella sp.]
QVAFAVDSRSGINGNEDPAALLKELKDFGLDVDVLFLTADTPTLLKRFSETRRRHPLSNTTGAETELTLTEAIEKERDIMGPFADLAASCDTTGLTSNALRNWVNQFASFAPSSMTIAFESFAFKRGIPYVADLVFDARNLPNPYYDEALRPFYGTDEPIVQFMKAYPQVEAFVQSIANFIETWLDGYAANNRRYFTVAIGCTGGQHRSVYVAQALYAYFKGKYPSVTVRHREMDSKKA